METRAHLDIGNRGTALSALHYSCFFCCSSRNKIAHEYFLENRLSLGRCMTTSRWIIAPWIISFASAGLGGARRRSVAAQMSVISKVTNLRIYFFNNEHEK